MGGWSDSGGDKWSRLVNDAAARANFNQNVISFIQQYGFDGLDLDWEYPKCWQGDCYAGPDSDREAFAQWIIELKAAFSPYGYLLSAAVSSSSYVIPQAYDVPTLSAYLDHINLMTYDYHGTWDSATGHVSPLYAAPNDDATLNSDYTVNYWISLGADPQKIVMGIPLYGNSYTLANPSNNGLNALFRGGAPGDITGSSGSLAFSEVCYYVIYEGWTVVREYPDDMGPYAYSNDQWVRLR
ncbi:Oviduct-specific glycoprotein [Armadillidium vulgare]|nr:Oviduct-specific glycoprotein [Armadillidium vulgare]